MVKPTSIFRNFLQGYSQQECCDKFAHWTSSAPLKSNNNAKYELNASKTPMDEKERGDLLLQIAPLLNQPYEN